MRLFFAILSFSIFQYSLAYAEKGHIILSFGDSITVGVWENTDAPLIDGIRVGNGTRTGGYGPDLEELIDQRNFHYDVLNFGYSGEYTIEYSGKKGGYRRLTEEVIPLYPNAQYAIIMEGTNDYWTGISRETTAYMLQLMVEACRTAGIEPILATLTPDTSAAGGTAKNIPAYNALIKNMAVRQNITLVDTYSAMVDEWETKYAYADYKGSWYIDYLHLSRVGYHKLAELYFNVIDIPSILIFPAVNLLLQKE